VTMRTARGLQEAPGDINGAPLGPTQAARIVGSIDARADLLRRNGSVTKYGWAVGGGEPARAVR
jgi:hypothetical protein